jgi:hypothetical protein
MTTIEDETLQERPVTTPESSSIAARYGRTPAKKRRDRLIYLAGGATAGIVLVVWVLWAGLNQSGNTLETQDKGATILDDRTVSISYQVSMPVGQTASCALQVQNEAHGIVGWRIVNVPASTRYTSSYTDTVLSSERGVTGLIYRCWLT